MHQAIEVLLQAIPYLIGGAGLTIVAVVGGMGLGLIIGLPMAVAQVYGPAPLRAAAGLYVWFFRGVPILVLLFLFYFGLFQLFQWNIGALTAATVVLGMTSGAYQSQIFRGAILSLARGQFRAASALGLSDRQAIRCIVLPQALRLSLPGWSNEYSILLKDSALAFVLGATEIMARTQFVATRTYQHLALSLAACGIYFILTWVGVRALRALERRVAVPGFGNQEAR
ncbi:amino acid ABC transporter permease [Oleispirillum naphthae]|uniref:amino acid ABC transporter permease n=1 Tax=Oleispirillum naphthae TaxID=2838853 RepID=UPI0030824E41